MMVFTMTCFEKIEKIFDATFPYEWKKYLSDGFKDVFGDELHPRKAIHVAYDEIRYVTVRDDIPLNIQQSILLRLNSYIKHIDP